MHCCNFLGVYKIKLIARLSNYFCCFYYLEFIYASCFRLICHQVVRAKKKDTGIVYALKIMDKKFITKENKTAYVKLERIVLDQLDHPGIVRLFFTFQDTFSLCRCLVISWKFMSYSLCLVPTSLYQFSASFIL